MMPVPGMSKINDNFITTALIDESFQLVAAHVDDRVKKKIVNSEYIDFALLLPRDRISRAEDHRMEMINKDRRTYFVQAQEREKSGVISNFSQWEQAFRVFSDIYTRHNPDRAAELIQYNHLIHTASLSFSWDNFYNYDHDFRLHLAQNPLRFWGKILQQPWSIRLKDLNGSHDMGNKGRRKKDICYRFNIGKCSYGQKCKFDHRCGICSKFGHGAHNCRHASQGDKRNNDKEEMQDKRRKDNDHGKGINKF